MRRLALVLCLCATVTVAAAQPAARATDWGVTRDPFDKTVIARLKAILARDPYDRALGQLVALYRKHRTVAQLEQEVGAQPETWASLVVQARLAQLAKRPALALYTLALAHNERDVRAWIALADASKPRDARLAYERALALSPPVPLRKAVLRKLAALPGDGDSAYARLIELDAKNGRLWLDRADALALRGRFAQAIDSYTAAEPLLKTDPERRLYAIAQRGRAHEQLGATDAALADYHRAIHESPRGYYLKTELVARVIAVHTKAGTLAALLAEYLRVWPEQSRGHFEWATLAQLHEALGARDAAISALEHAIAKDASMPATHYQLIKLLERAGQQQALIAALDKLSRSVPSLANVHHDLGERYLKSGHVDLAVREYEIVAKLEPEVDNFVVLGDAYWLADKKDRAIAAWRRIARADTADAWAALGTVLVDHGVVEDALDAYTRALAKQPNNPELWRARGAVYESAEVWNDALADTDQAIALLGTAPRDVGHPARYQLVRILSSMASSEEAEARVADWETKFAMDDDLAAGYLLAELYGSSPSTLLEHVLERLHQAVPRDDGITLELIRAHRIQRHYTKAIAVARTLARASPARAADMTKLIAKIEEDRSNNPEPLLWLDDSIGDPEAEILAARNHAPSRDPFDDMRLRAGVRIGVGAGLGGAASRALTVGAIATLGPGRVVLVTRVDYTQRASEMRSASAVAGSIGVSARVLTRPAYALMLGGAPRFERRFGTAMADDARSALAVDTTIDLVTRRLPLALGMRFEQSLSDQRTSSLMLELGVELR